MILGFQIGRDKGECSFKTLIVSQQTIRKVIERQTIESLDDLGGDLEYAQ